MASTLERENTAARMDVNILISISSYFSRQQVAFRVADNSIVLDAWE